MNNGENGSTSGGTLTSFTRKTSPRAGSAAAQQQDQQFQTDLLNSFKKGLATSLSTLRTHLQAMVKADNEAARLKETQDLYRRVHAITANAGMVGLSLIAH